MAVQHSLLSCQFFKFNIHAIEGLPAKGAYIAFLVKF